MQESSNTWYNGRNRLTANLIGTDWSSTTHSDIIVMLNCQLSAVLLESGLLKSGILGFHIHLSDSRANAISLQRGSSNCQSLK